MPTWRRRRRAHRQLRARQAPGRRRRRRRSPRSRPAPSRCSRRGFGPAAARPDRRRRREPGRAGHRSGAGRQSVQTIGAPTREIWVKADLDRLQRAWPRPELAPAGAPEPPRSSSRRAPCSSQFGKDANVVLNGAGGRPAAACATSSSARPANGAGLLSGRRHHRRQRQATPSSHRPRRRVPASHADRQQDCHRQHARRLARASSSDGAHCAHPAPGDADATWSPTPRPIPSSRSTPFGRR